jgi:putative membrane protein
MSNYLSLLPHLNALLNSTSAALLLIGYIFIKLGRVKAHRTCQVSAFATSTVFLVSYLTYHYFHGTTRFAGQGVARPIYLTILFTHTVLAIVIVPLVLITLYRAVRGDFVKHRRIARWTLPLWLYVSVTGVVVYFMLYRIYPAL